MDITQVYNDNKNSVYRLALTYLHSQAEAEELSEHIPVKDTQSLDILETVMSLSVKERTVVYLYYYKGYAAKEIAGDLRMGKNGIEAIVIMSEGHNDEQTARVYQLAADSYVEYNMDEVYTQLGGAIHLFNVKYVNDHVIALVGVDIYSCLNAETLEEQTPEEGLQEFVQMMGEKNNHEVFPPMTTWNDTILTIGW